MTTFERLGRLAARRRWWFVGAWVVLLVAAIPLATQASGALRSGGFIRQDLESARAKQLLHDKLGIPEAAVAVVFYSPTLRAGEPQFEAAAAQAMSAIPSAKYVINVVPHTLATDQVSVDRHTAYDIVYLDLPADDSPARPARDPRRPRAPAGPRGRPRRRAGVLRRRPDGVRIRPPAQRGNLPAAGRPRAPARLRIDGRGGPAARRRWGGGPRGARRGLRRGVADPDEHLRPEPGDAPRPRPRRRLLAPHDEPLPRGAGRPRRPRRRGPGCGRRDDGHGRPRRLLLRPDRPPRTARASSCSTS